MNKFGISTIKRDKTKSLTMTSHENKMKQNRAYLYISTHEHAAVMVETGGQACLPAPICFSSQAAAAQAFMGLL